MKQKWQYKVVKSQRGVDGKWFTYPAAATFATELKAQEYALQFAAEQRAEGVSGTRINVISRRSVRGEFGWTNSLTEYRV